MLFFTIEIACILFMITGVYILNIPTEYILKTKMQVCGYITSEGFLVPDRVLKDRFGENYVKLIKKLTLTHYPKIGPPKSAKMYKYKDRDGTRWIYLPRTLSQTLAKIIPAVIALPPICQIGECPLQIELFENQQIVLAELMKVYTPDRIAAGTASCILNLRAGMGKTFVAGGLISQVHCEHYTIAQIPIRFKQFANLKMFYTAR